MRKLFLISSLLIMSMFTLTACGKSNEDINVGTGTDATETNSTATDAKYTLTDDEANAFADSFGTAPSVTAVNAKSNDKTKDVTTEATTTETTSDTDKSDKKKDGSKDDTKPSKPVDSSCNHNWVSTQVLVKEAWTETVVDVPEKTEKVLVREAWDETVTEKVLVKDAWDEEVFVGYRAIQNVTGEDVTDVGIEWCESHNCDNHFFGGGPCRCDNTAKPVYKTVHHDAEYKTVTKTIHHDAEYKTVTTPAQTHTVNHPAEYRTVKKCSECGAQK